MSQHDKPVKIAKILRNKAEEFLSNPNLSNNLLDVIKHFETGADTSPIEHTLEHQYRQWLRNLYEETWSKLLTTLENSSIKIQIQALSSSMNILTWEGRYPLEPKGTLECYVPLNRLKLILMKILSNKQHNPHLVAKFEEYLAYDDILFYVWRVLPGLTAKSNPNDIYIMNYLLLLEKLQVKCNDESRTLCSSGGMNMHFNFDEAAVKRYLNKIWNCIILWEHTPATHKQLLIVLLEKVLPYLDKPLLLTDFLMDSLDVGGPVSLLALQGIFTMIQAYNLDYPNIFAKLYSMFEPEIFHTKFKPRLFYLADLFLSSTHLPENLVAAFAKRLARLALVAPSEDIIIICMFIGNLVLRHPGLKCLLNHSIGGTTTNDPYIMEERDPLKSNAINSSLWEIQTLQSHALPTVAAAATFINNPLPSIEWDISKVLENTGDNIFDKELKKNSKLVALAFDKPNRYALSKGEKVLNYWN
ncbi:hypothetical protein Trydic_g14072 [Trypoxylus dichotomus]